MPAYGNEFINYDNSNIEKLYKISYSLKIVYIYTLHMYYCILWSIEKFSLDYQRSGLSELHALLLYSVNLYYMHLLKYSKHYGISLQCTFYFWHDRTVALHSSIDYKILICVCVTSQPNYHIILHYHC